MKKFIRLCFTILALIFISNSAIAHFEIQTTLKPAFKLKEIDPPFASLLKNLENYTKNFLVEKVHVHLDKPYYAAGENIWFKAYVLNSQTAASSNLSQILFVDLLDEQGNLFKQARVPLLKGLGWADFSLPDTLEEGNYRVRAYTQWMKNAGKDYYFDKVVKIGSSWSNQLNINAQFDLIEESDKNVINANLIFSHKDGHKFPDLKVNYEALNDASTLFSGSGRTDAHGNLNLILENKNAKSSEIKNLLLTTIINNKKVSKLIPIITNSQNVDLQFFPESGQMIAGITSKIAFKATTNLGKGVYVTGKILNKENVEVAKFESNDLGMGSFYLLPQSNQEYKAILDNSNVQTPDFQLPKINTSGYVLSVDNQNPEKIAVKVAFSTELSSADSLSLILHQDGYPVYSSQIPGTKNAVLLNLPKANLPSGIYTLTLLNQNQTAVAERILFIQNEDDKIRVESTNLKSSYGKRQDMNLDFTGLAWEPNIRTNYSVSVTHTSSVIPDEENETNIFTSLLLKSDLRGYIEKPNRYFINQDKQNLNDLDHLMLTQGWRKINWELVKNANYPEPEFKAEAFLPITGKVTNIFGSPIPNAKVSLINPYEGYVPTDTLTDAKGRFNFDKFLYVDTSRFIAHTVRKNKATDLIISIDSLHIFDAPSLAVLGDYSLNINQDLAKYLKANDAYFEELKRQGNLNGVINLKEIEIAGKKVVKDESFYKSFHGMRKPDITIETKELGFMIDVRTAIAARYTPPPALFGSIGGGGGGMMFIVDGIIGAAVPDIQNVSLIEIIKPTNPATAIYGARGGNGIVLITTKWGPDAVNKATNFIQFSPPGITLAREFYSPKYTSPADNRGKDLRKTVYWNPNVLSEKDGKFSLNYFNTDEPGTYRMVIEGISESGQLARKVFTYEVN